ncbi:12545_t:CDS:2 [Cetraspora pellucida]|uniref:12545_t:CDS:1 n=1 Tax=Cetraspora pellucida TaxID=1433469 RepID=A0A9N9BNH0_9GLOM|nr:12545_t:CDS:2 [Cetraspora pellucida]
MDGFEDLDGTGGGMDDFEDDWEELPMREGVNPVLALDQLLMEREGNDMVILM